MYTPSAFSENRPARLREVVEAYPLATVFAVGPNGLDAEVVPFVWVPNSDGRDESGRLLGHLARGNPLARADPSEVLVQFRGPDGYVSPGWYPEQPQHGRVVPTWNYVVVEMRGALRRIEEPERVRAILTMLTDRFESRFDAPWRVTDAPVDYVESLLGGIVGIEIVIQSIVGKFKLSQNKGVETVAGVVTGLRQSGRPRDAELADWMARNHR